MGERAEVNQSMRYMSGFRNEHTSEALPGALPIGQNSPQRCAYGLYAEQLSGSAFTAPRHHNLRSWLYRVRPSVCHQGEFKRVARESLLWLSAPLTDKQRDAASHLTIGPRRWAPLPIPNKAQERLTFMQGIKSYTLSGSVDASTGMAAHLYVMNAPMRDSRTKKLQHLVNADAELLIIPQTGALRVSTELGVLEVEPTEIVVIPRGVAFRVDPLDEGSGESDRGVKCRGYICENYGAPFELPQLGPIGANCLASPRDFLSPVAHYDEETLNEPSELFMRWGGELYKADLAHSPLDVVAWHGNYAPYKYDLKRFATIGSISFDHPDPSIFTVLTSPSNTPGVANVDFVIFPDRWLVAEHTFRPPWYHRNIMSEFMGLITGAYDAKEEGFLPGGASLHNLMLAHGPDASGFEKASAAELKPQRLSNTLAFMFETRAPQHVTPYAACSHTLEATYRECWDGLPPAQLPKRSTLSS